MNQTLILTDSEMKSKHYSHFFFLYKLAETTASLSSLLFENLCLRLKRDTLVLLDNKFEGELCYVKVPQKEEQAFNVYFSKLRL